MSGRRQTAHGDTAAAARHGGAPRVPGRDPAVSILALQRVAGNRALRQLLRAPKLDLRVPKDLAASKARPLPAVASPAGAGTAAVKADPKGPSWQDAGGTTESGTVGTMKRILLDGLPGTQQEQPAQKIKPPPGGPGFADAIGSGPRGQRGRAVAIVPPHLTPGRARSRSSCTSTATTSTARCSAAWGCAPAATGPRTSPTSRFPQQLEAFVGSRPGARIVVLMPIGVTVPAGTGHTTAFGIRDLDAYVAASLKQLGLAETPDGIYLSGHSGGGFTISGLVGGGLPKSVRGVFGFESFHSSDLTRWQKLATDRLDERAEGARGGPRGPAGDAGGRGRDRRGPDRLPARRGIPLHRLRRWPVHRQGPGDPDRHPRLVRRPADAAQAEGGDGRADPHGRPRAAVVELPGERLRRLDPHERAFGGLALRAGARRAAAGRAARPGAAAAEPAAGAVP